MRDEVLTKAVGLGRDFVPQTSKPLDIGGRAKPYKSVEVNSKFWKIYYGIRQGGGEPRTNSVTWRADPMTRNFSSKDYREVVL